MYTTVVHQTVRQKVFTTQTVMHIHIVMWRRGILSAEKRLSDGLKRLSDWDIKSVYRELKVLFYPPESHFEDPKKFGFIDYRGMMFVSAVGVGVVLNVPLYGYRAGKYRYGHDVNEPCFNPLLPLQLAAITVPEVTIPVGMAYGIGALSGRYKYS